MVMVGGVARGAKFRDLWQFVRVKNRSYGKYSSSSGAVPKEASV